MNLGNLPQSRFILAHLGLLVSEHHGHSLSLLLNSGVLALSQSILRLVGMYFMSIYSSLQRLSSLQKLCFHDVDIKNETMMIMMIMAKNLITYKSIFMPPH